MLCSFWLADNLTAQGRIDEAEKVYASLCRRASTLGLLPEQIHPTSGEFMGNFPQAFSHIGIIAGDEPIAVYLALPPALFPHAVAALHEADLPPGSRIVLEKPFGEDLAGARELNRLLAALVPEEAVFRDATGALKDMVQNHLLQLLCLVAMEPPITLGERDLHNRKADVLRSVRPLTEQDAARRTRRARYVAGRVGGHAVPAYVDEEGVRPARHTETFAEVELELDSWRWAGTTFRLRSGKALGQDRKEVAVRFRPVPHLPFGNEGEAVPNVLRFGLEPEGMTLDMTGTGAHAQALTPLSLTARMEPPHLPAYGQLLRNVMTGDPALSIPGDEAEEAWRVLTPVLRAWEKNLVPLEEYPAGSGGPPPRPAGGAPIG